MPDKLLTLEEALPILGLSGDEVKKLVARGEIPHYHVAGKFLRFRREELLRFRESRGNNPAGPDRLSPVEKIKDFLYSYDYFILALAAAAALAGVLIYRILK